MEGASQENQSFTDRKMDVYMWWPEAESDTFNIRVLSNIYCQKRTFIWQETLWTLGCSLNEAMQCKLWREHIITPEATKKKNPANTYILDMKHTICRRRKEKCRLKFENDKTGWGGGGWRARARNRHYSWQEQAAGGKRTTIKRVRRVLFMLMPSSLNTYLWFENGHLHISRNVHQTQRSMITTTKQTASAGTLFMLSAGNEE